MLNAAYSPSVETRPRQPVLTLAAALLLVILMGSVLLAVALREDAPSSPAGGLAGDDQLSGILQATATASATIPPTPLDSITATFAPHTTVPLEISATPILITVMPTLNQTQIASATPNAEALTPVVITVMPTSTPTPFIGQPLSGPIPPPVSARLEGVPYEAQQWNNSGPANLSMALRTYGWIGDQQVAAGWLKPNSEDKSVSPWQMVYYVNRFTDYKAIYRLGGTTELLRRLIAAGIPVIIQTGFQPEGDDWMGHHLLIWGYEGSQKFLLHDSYLGPDQTLSADEIESGWRDFAHTFIVVYDPAREMDLRLALGAYADPVAAAGAALIARQMGAGGFASDAWGAFSLGTAYVTVGDFENAAEMYDRAFEMGLPWRTLWYQFGPFEVYFHTGRYMDLVRLIDGTLAIAEIEEAYYWRGMAYAADGADQRDTEGAAASFARVLELNPNFFTAQTEYFRLESASFNLPPQMMGVAGEMPRPEEATVLPLTVVPAAVTLDYTATAIIDTATAMPTVTATPIIGVPVVSPTPAQ